MAGQKESVEFEISLDTSKASSAGKSAATALERLQASLQKSQTKYDELGRAMQKMQMSSSVNIEAWRKLEARHKAAGQQSESLKAKISRVKTEMSNSAAAERRVAQQKAFEAKIAGLKSGLAGLAGLLKTAALGLVAFGAAALVAATGVAVTLTTMALKFGDARWSELLHLEAVSKMYSVWGIVREKGAFVQAAIDKISDSSFQSREKIAGYAEELQKMGLRGQNLTNILEAMTLASTDGDEAAARYKSLALQAVYFGSSTAAVLKDAKARYQDLSDKMASGLGVQLRKLKDNVGRLFAGVNIEPFLRGLKQVTQLLSPVSATGKQIQQIFSYIFSNLFGSDIGSAADRIRDFVDNAIGYVLDLLLKLKAISQAGKGSFSDAVVSWLGDIAGKMYEYFSTNVAPAIIRIGLQLAWTFVKAFTVTIGQLLGRALADIGEFISNAATAGQTAGQGGLAAQQIAAMRESGANSAQGVADGINANKGAAIEAMGGLAADMKREFDRKLEIHSPSRLFFRESFQVPAGAALGIRAGAPAVRAAVNDTFNVHFPPPAQPFALPAPGPLPIASQSRGNVTVENLTVQAKSDDPQALAESVREALQRELEGTAIQLGAM